MESRRQLPRLVCFILLLLVEIAESRSLRRDGERHKVKKWSHLGTSYETSDPYYYAGSPFSMPPYGDAMGPGSSSAQDYPPFCIYPPLTPTPPTISPYLPSPPPPPPPPPLESTNPPEFPVPSPPVYIPGPPVYEPNPPTAVPSPTGFVPSPPPPSFTIPGTPGFLPSPPPPSYIVPGTPESVPFPPPPPPQPIYVFPTPPGFVPSPPEFVPTPPEFEPGPPIFLPPVVYPSPLVPPPQVRGRWCVAKPSVPDPIIQEAMNYACGSGADCDSIQPSGPCYEPNTMIGHASFAFNGYWQRTKVAGGTCDFGGTAMLVTKDPSYDGCHFIIY